MVFSYNVLFLSDAEIEGVPMKVEYAKEGGIRKGSLGRRRNSQGDKRRDSLRGRKKGFGLRRGGLGVVRKIANRRLGTRRNIRRGSKLFN